MTQFVLDASAAVELVARTPIGEEIAELVAPDPVFWVPDGLFDVEVHAVLRRWDLNGVMTPDWIASARLRLSHLRARRAAVTALADRSWLLRANITFSDGCYVALAEARRCSLVTSDWKLVESPALPVPTVHPRR